MFNFFKKNKSNLKIVESATKSGTKPKAIGRLNFDNYSALNTDKIDNSVVSTAHMSTEEYVAAIIDDLTPYWEDKVLLEKLGVDTVFGDNVKVNNKLTYEDACECYSRLHRITKMTSYVEDEFESRLENLPSEKQASFCSANTIRDLFIEANEVIELKSLTCTDNMDEAIETINAMLSLVNGFTKGAIEMIVIFALTELQVMMGFSNEC